jgi:uncharacterized membrane protein
MDPLSNIRRWATDGNKTNTLNVDYNNYIITFAVLALIGFWLYMRGGIKNTPNLSSNILINYVDIDTGQVVPAEELGNYEIVNLPKTQTSHTNDNLTNKET